MKRKKATRAYKMGHTDGMSGVNDNDFAKGSPQYNDYERGFQDGMRWEPELNSYDPYKLET